MPQQQEKFIEAISVWCVGLYLMLEGMARQCNCENFYTFVPDGLYYMFNASTPCGSGERKTYKARIIKLGTLVPSD